MVSLMSIKLNYSCKIIIAPKEFCFPRELSKKDLQLLSSFFAVFFLELLNTSSSIYKFLLSRIERMALVADLNSLVAYCTVNLKFVSTGTMYFTKSKIWVYFCFHPMSSCLFLKLILNNINNNIVRFKVGKYI